jgi:predicted DsbA family dithiol-disulfide isomerase
MTQTITAARPLKVEVWSDVVCPWCYIGKRRLEGALQGFEHAGEVEVIYRSFELDPRAPATPDGTLAERLARKYVVTLEQAQAMNRRVTDTAAGEGLEYNLDIARPGNTFDAHRLIHLAAAEGKQADMKERLMAAYFVEGRAVSDRETLIALGAELGISADRARQVLESDDFADEVRADEREAGRLGIGGVPFFVIDRQYGFSGAQPAELLREGLARAWAGMEPAVIKPGGIVEG